MHRMLPFIPRQEAQVILEEHYLAQEARAEFLAEAGSSYFYGGMSSADAMWAAQRDDLEREFDFYSSPEGERYSERLEAARFMEAITFGGLHLDDAAIPEFVLGYSNEAHEALVRDFYAHSPFRLSPNRFQRPIDLDDIPF